MEQIDRFPLLVAFLINENVCGSILFCLLLDSQNLFFLVPFPVKAEGLLLLFPERKNFVL
jgi:hypothetical protein